jgi:hypothetical protein
LDKNAADVTDKMLDTGFLILDERGILSILLMVAERADFAKAANGYDGPGATPFLSIQQPVSSIQYPGPRFFTSIFQFCAIYYRSVVSALISLECIIRCCPGWICSLNFKRFQMINAGRGTSNRSAMVDRLSPSLTT